MKLIEFQGKKIFDEYGVPIPKSELINDSDNDLDIDIGFPAVVKAQLPFGGRGKAGGIKFSENVDELAQVCKEIFQKKVKGETVKSLLIEEKFEHDREMYVSITMDKSANMPLLMAVSEGGVNVEERANSEDVDVVKKHIDPTIGIPGYLIQRICRDLDIEHKRQFGSIVKSLFNIFMEKNAQLVEINPLAESEEGLVALDSKIILDDEAEFKHRELFKKLKKEKKELTSKVKTDAEKIAEEYGVSYVPLDGNIGLISDGAGTGMLTLDVISDFGGTPANFCEMGGKADDEIVERSMEVVLNNSDIDVLLITLIGGLTRMDYMAEGIARFMEKIGTDIPIVIRMCGTKTKEGKEILDEIGLDTYEDHSEAVQRAVEIAGGK